MKNYKFSLILWKISENLKIGASKLTLFGRKCLENGTFWRFAKNRWEFHVCVWEFHVCLDKENRQQIFGFYVDLALKEVECRAVVRELEAVKLRLQQIEAEQEKTWINHITDSVSKFKFK